jgi:hypothetical protein
MRRARRHWWVVAMAVIVAMLAPGTAGATGYQVSQRDFARDPVSWAAHTYLSIETMSL